MSMKRACAPVQIPVPAPELCRQNLEADTTQVDDEIAKQGVCMQAVQDAGDVPAASAEASAQVCTWPL